MLHAGIDEAGYGPTLGPLAIARAMAHVDSEEPWPAFVGTGVADSKQVHTPGDLAPLERVALAGITWLSGFQPDTAADVFALLGEASTLRTSAWWMAGADDLRLPVAAGTVPVWQVPGVTPAGIAGALIQPLAYNAWVRSGRNKAALELHHVGRLLAQVPAPGRVVIDRLGGRRYYGAWLSEVRGVLVETVEETAQAGRYQVDGLTVEILVGGEAASPLTALASCIAKYARELHMLLLNRAWGGRMPWLKPTAGYPEDAKRWLHQIGEGFRNAHGEELVRGFQPTWSD